MEKIGALICLAFPMFITVLANEPTIQNESIQRFLSKSWKVCSIAPSIFLCIKQRSLLALDKLSKTDDEISFPGDLISLVKTNGDGDQKTSRIFEDDLQRHLPKDDRLQEQALNTLIHSAYLRFLSSRSLQIRFPQTYINSNASISEGRGDKKKGGGAMMGAMMAACMMVPFALAAIGMIAGKALMISMLALMLSLLLGMRRGHEGGGGSSYEVISLPAGGHHSHHSRSLQSDQLAYKGSKPLL